MKIVYLAHTAEHIYRQCYTSILSALGRSGLEAHDIIVYTDAPSFFEDLGVRTELLTDTQLVEWKGEDDNLFRPKIMTIRHALETYQDTVLFVDCDTLWMQEVPSIAAGTTILHLKEGNISSETRAQTYRDYFTLRYNDHPPLSDTVIYNAGMIGITYDDKSLIDDVLSFCDLLYKENGYRLSEQTAFSYIFQNASSLQEGYEYLLHYWPFKGARFQMSERLLTLYQNKQSLEEKIQGVMSYVPKAQLTQIIDLKNLPAIEDIGAIS